VWFRGKDLRLADHGPLAEAAAAGEVLPLFVLDPHFFAPERAAALPHRMAHLLDGLVALADGLARAGSRLVVVAGKSAEAVPRVAEAWRADQVLAHRWSEPFARERDRRVEAALGRTGIAFRLFEGETLLPPGSVRSGQGTPFRVFTPFARAVMLKLELFSLLRVPSKLPPVSPDLGLEECPIPTLAALGLTANPRLSRGGEAAGRARLRAFVEGPLAAYAQDRDRLDRDGTSRLSADLHFGTLSIRSVWQAVAEAGAGESGRRFLAELLWREFSHHLLWDFPHLLERPFRPAFEGFPWQNDAAAWEAWTAGLTGYPLVDAAARQLREEGFVPNRARMVAASFLAKHLLVDFRKGEAHYLRWLTDGDWAVNDAGWQWSAGCGCDAQPWFRVFNPTVQGRRFDPQGAYVRRWVPELADCPDAHLHAPWKAGRLRGYPPPIVDHAAARARFLAVARTHLAPGLIE
jgi:deoxyribodipyrimidine photo-lyase